VFTINVEATFGMVHALVIGVGPMIGWLELLQTIDQASKMSLDAFAEGTVELPSSSLPERKERGGAKPSRPASPSGRSAPDGARAVPILNAARNHAARQIKATLEGFARACREVADLDPETVIAAFVPFLTEHLDPFASLMAQADPDPNAVEDCFQGYASVWKAWMNSGTPQQKRGTR
jgi:hypothetical protein